jgi:hypothetical protein
MADKYCNLQQQHSSHQDKNQSNKEVKQVNMTNARFADI